MPEPTPAGTTVLARLASGDCYVTLAEPLGRRQKAATVVLAGAYLTLPREAVREVFCGR